MQDRHKDDFFNPLFVPDSRRGAGRGYQTTDFRLLPEQPPSNRSSQIFLFLFSKSGNQPSGPSWESKMAQGHFLFRFWSLLETQPNRLNYSNKM
jgi:hypothetical protein